jgi:hypothetical protein
MVIINSINYRYSAKVNLGFKNSHNNFNNSNNYTIILDIRKYK